MAAIVHNSGVNYTLYYNVLNYFKTIMTNHPSIQIVTTGLIQDLDTREFPQYPIGNVSILSSNILGTTTDWEIQLIIADKIKNKNNESDPQTNEQSIDFYGVDDVVDIHANTLAIINDLTAYTAKGVDGFEINDTITCEPFEDRFNNGLAGWVSTFTLTVHNDRNRCLFFLINPTGTGYKIQNCLTNDIKYAVISGSVSIGDYFSSNIGNVTNCFYVSSSVSDFDSWDYVNLKPIDFYGSCNACLTGIIPTTTSTTTLSPTTSTTTIEPTTSTTTIELTTSTTTEVPTTTTTTLVPTTSTTTLTPTTTLAPTTTTTFAPGIYKYYSDKQSGNGHNIATCTTGSCIYPIYANFSPITNYSASCQIDGGVSVITNKIFYTDPAGTIRWDGASDWFGVSTTESGSSQVAFPVTGNGRIFCYELGTIYPVNC